MAKKFSIPASINVDRAYATHYGKDRVTTDRLLEALREFVSNSDDAFRQLIKDDPSFVPRIDITLKKKEKILRVTDNGHGFRRIDLEGFFKLHDSVKRGQKDQTGQHGTGRGKGMRFASRLDVSSVSSDFPKGVRTSLTHEHLLGLLRHQKVEGQAEEGLPDWWPLPAGQTGTVVEVIMDDDDWKRMPSADTIIERLAGYFRPSVAAIIRINDKPLKKRPIIGEAVIGEREIPGLGKCSWELFLPEKWDNNSDGIYIGGHHPVCRIETFIAGLQDTDLEALIPEIIRDGRRVSGLILFPEMNDFVAESRKELRGELYGGMHTKILSFLSDILGPDLDAAFARKMSEEKRREKGKVLRDFADDLPELEAKEEGGGKGDEDEPLEKKKEKKKVIQPDLKVNQMSVTLMPGDSFVFYVTRHKNIDEKKLRWEGSNSGGTITLTEGVTTTYDAGPKITEDQTKPYTLTVYNVDNPDQRLEISITIEPVRSFRISPNGVRIEQGDVQTFRLRNFNAEEGEVEWTLESPEGERQSGIRLQSKKGLSTIVETTETCKLGRYTLRATVKKNPDRKAEVNFTVCKADHGPSIVLDGQRFFLKPETNLGAELIHVGTDINRGEGPAKTVKVVKVNFEHPDYQALERVDAAKEGRTQFLMNGIIVAYAEYLVTEGELEPVKAFQKIRDLRTGIMTARAKPSKK